jgi:hypothetical protein
MSDDRNILDVIDRSSQNWTGESRTPDDIIGDFHLYSHAKRATQLDQLDDAFAAADTSDLRKYSELCRMRRQLKGIHHTLRKAGR